LARVGLVGGVGHTSDCVVGLRTARQDG
jgi:hypothetical protein